MDPKVYPPFRFNHVAFDAETSSVYRGAFPRRESFMFLECLRLRTVLTLVPAKTNLDETVFTELANWCSSHGVDHIVVTMPKRSALEATARAFEELISTVFTDVRRLPLFVHCTDGGEMTGALIACLRRLQNWRSRLIEAEYARVGKRTEADLMSEDQRRIVFELVAQVTLQETASLPGWLAEDDADYGRLFQHPTLNVLPK